VIAAGQSIGNYRILNKIGTGGMGAVYLAEHPLIGKRVALKVIHRELAGNREVVSRFFQEARAVNKIGNEHIVEIHDFGVTPEGDHFYIMEYLEGRTLASVLSRDKALDVMRSLHIGAQIASALAAAHAAGIIHRDLKPDNIMLMARLGEQDFVKVLDFGLAKVFSAGTAVKTAAGVLLGTPQYMSPEACESKRDVDHRTDIYALGVLLFQMMTGVLPFDGESMGEVLVKQVTTLPPAPRAMNAAIPPSVEQILLRCLAKPVDARFPTMIQLREALLDPEAYLRGSPPIAPARAVTSAFVIGDARTMAMPAAPAAPLAVLPAAMQKTRIADPGLPLPPPMPSMSGAASAPTVIADRAPRGRASAGMPALAPPQELVMNTMRIATPMGYSSRPPRRVWPVVLGMGLLLGVGGGILSVTCFGHDNAVRSGEAEARAVDGSRGSSDTAAATAGGSPLAVADSGSATPATESRPPTIGSPAASSESRPPTIGSAAPSSESRPPTIGNASPSNESRPPTIGSAAPSSEKRPPTIGSAAPSNDPRPPTIGSAAPSSDARPPTFPAEPAAPAATVHTAHLTIESVPTGAAVKGPRSAALGKTPLALEWPTSDAPVTFELRLGGYKAKQKQTVINGNTRLVIELERIPVRRTRPPSRPSGPGNELMRPDP
jgi:tRNA A-37 threonylcarbamoyl transferase component Bud32